MNNTILFYLIYPAVVAIISGFFSFYGSYKLHENEQRNENNSLKKDFIEKIIIALERLNLVLSKLSDDPVKYNYFALQTIATAKPILQRLQTLTVEKLSLFEDKQFRSNILNSLDEVTSIVEEIESMELNPVNKYTQHQTIVKETLAEYNAFKIKLLELEIYLDNTNVPKNFDPLKDDDSTNKIKLNQVSLIVQSFVAKIDSSQRELDANNLKAKEQRSFLAVKLLNAQSKVKDLVSDLNGKRL